MWMDLAHLIYKKSLYANIYAQVHVIAHPSKQTNKDGSRFPFGSPSREGQAKCWVFLWEAMQSSKAMQVTSHQSIKSSL